MQKLVYTWRGLKTIGGRKTHFCVTYLGKAFDGWQEYYGSQKPWQARGYSNPIFCIDKKNSGYDEMLERHRVIFCLLWHQIHL
ncbi:MAG: hypothetical protein II278_08830 [Bacteroidaceae bacterium]|nr:hypothetical protein [Bacteroidaceae bacterium]